MITYLNSNDIQRLWWLLFTFLSNSYFIVESKIFSLNQIFSRQIARCSSCSVSLLTVFVLVTHYWENISWETVCFAPSSGQLSWAYLISTNAQRTLSVRTAYVLRTAQYQLSLFWFLVCEKNSWNFQDFLKVDPWETEKILRRISDKNM